MDDDLSRLLIQAPLTTAKPPTRPIQLLLAHGAGAPMDSPFMETFCAACSAHGIETARFEFAYMSQRRETGKRRPPPAADTLTESYQEFCLAWHAQSVAVTAGEDQRPVRLIGGKSMGGRVATMVADDLVQRDLIDGVVCLGYPFHPQGKPEALRTAHLQKLHCPTLIIQGERDPFGNRDEVESYNLADAISIQWLTDGDHDFGPRGRSGATRRGNIEAAAAAVRSFSAALD